MTEFTKEDIEYYRKQYALWTSRRQTTPEELHLIGRLRDTLDYIEHLQAENDKLTAELARRDEIIKRLVKKVLRMDDFVGDSDHEHDDRIL